MTRATAFFSVAILLVVAVLGYVVYEQLVPQPGATTTSENWAGYADRQSVGWASGTITLPSEQDWHGSGEASLWVGMGGNNWLGQTSFPFWQAGVVISCGSGICSAQLFDEGGTQGAPCNGVCPVNWTQQIGIGAGDAITITVSGGTSGAVATLTVDQGGFNSTYRPPPWSVLAGVSSFPSAEWIFESPEGPQGMYVMPTLSPPGAGYSSLGDSAAMSDVGPIQMQGNPNGQSVSVSGLSSGSFSAYSYNA